MTDALLALGLEEGMQGRDNERGYSDTAEGTVLETPARHCRQNAE